MKFFAIITILRVNVFAAMKNLVFLPKFFNFCEYRRPWECSNKFGIPLGLHYIYGNCISLNVGCGSEKLKASFGFSLTLHYI
jgi:hypothetical protein